MDTLEKLMNGLTNVPKDVAGNALVRMTAAGLEKRGLADKYEYIERAIEELSVILKMKFSNYFLIVENDICRVGELVGHLSDADFDMVNEAAQKVTSLSDQMNRNALPEEKLAASKQFVDGFWKWVVDFMQHHQTMPGMSKGPGRGSAAGSLVTYAIGITDIDPIQNDLLFARFLNPERVSNPDIDTDLSSADDPYGARDIVIAYLTSKYGSRGICGIATPSTLAPKGALRAIARIEGSRQTLEGKGKTDAKYIASTFLRIGNTLADMVPKGQNVSFTMDVGGMTLKDSILNQIRELVQKGSVTPEDGLHMQNILSMAVRAEGLNIHYGRHACGMIISDNGDIAAYAPQMMDIQTGTLKIQMDAESAEAKGFLKMDLLALQQLNKITSCMRMVYKNHGIYLDEKHFPQESEVYSKIFAGARTNEVFQFESQGMKQMLRDFHPDCFSDIALLVACYRPGPLQYLPGIIARKQGKAAAETAVTKIASYFPKFAEIVRPTYYSLVYQEQIMQTFQVLAGYSMGGADNVRRAMGHKKMDVLTAEKKAFVYGDPDRKIKGAIATGIAEKDALSLFDEMTEFAKYSFNKSHAVAYAYVAYISAWLKYHYPAEFYASVMSITKKEKYPDLIAEARRMGIDVKGPDINLSEYGFMGNGKTIRFGFSGIKNLGNAAQPILAMRAAGEPPFTCFADYVERSQMSFSTTRYLVEAGCFDSFGVQRAAILDSMAEFYKHMKVIKDKTKEKSRVAGMLKDLSQGLTLDRKKWSIKTKSLPTKEKLEMKLESLDQVLSAERDAVRTVNFSLSVLSDRRQELEQEKELLGAYVSGHPLDLYGSAKEYRAKPIGELYQGPCTVFGLISNLTIRYRKDDHKEMAFFTLSDQTGSVDVKCFTDSYAANKDFLKEGAAVIIHGRAFSEKVVRKEGDEEKEDITTSLVCNKEAGSIEKAQEQGHKLILTVADPGFLKEAVDAMKEHQTAVPGPDTCRVIILVGPFKDQAELGFYVTADAGAVQTNRYQAKLQ